MPGPWEAWKTESRFPTLPTAPWKSRKTSEISTFPPPQLAPDGKVENHKPVSHFSIRTQATMIAVSTQTPKPKKGSRPLRGLLILTLFMLHPAFESKPDFMLILGLENAPATKMEESMKRFAA